jgi:hypothetical protein
VHRSVLGSEALKRKRKVKREKEKENYMRIVYESKVLLKNE